MDECAYVAERDWCACPVCVCVRGGAHALGFSLHFCLPDVSPFPGLQRALQPGKGGSGGSAADALARAGCGRDPVGSSERLGRALGPKSGGLARLLVLSPLQAPAGPRGQGSRRAVGRLRKGDSGCARDLQPGGPWVRGNLGSPPGGGYPGLSTAAVWPNLRHSGH